MAGKRVSVTDDADVQIKIIGYVDFGFYADFYGTTYLHRFNFILARRA